MKDVNSKKTISKRSALLLVRTPLQAWIAEKVLRAESVSSYEVVYFTQDDSEEDRYYYSRLSAKADNGQYCYSPRHRFDISNHLDFRRQAKKWHRDQRHDLTLMGSITAHVINAISSQQVTSELVTFDDGTYNILTWDKFHVDSISWRSCIYRKLLGATDLERTKTRIARHYTLHPQFENIVEPGRLKTLPEWGRDEGQSIDGTTRTYFIGQPFEEDLTFEQISVLKTYLLTLSVDFYVRHPRERITLELRVPYLEKEGQIAEDAIVNNAGRSQIHVVGWFSTVLFNIGQVAHRRTMILLHSDRASHEMAKLGTKAGCEIVFI